MAKRGKNRYAVILVALFKKHYRRGRSSFEIKRAEFEAIAEEVGIDLPKNLGDLLYSFR